MAEEKKTAGFHSFGHPQRELTSVPLSIDEDARVPPPIVVVLLVVVVVARP